MKSTPSSPRRIGHIVILSVVLTWLGGHGFTLPRIPFVNINHRISRGLIPKVDPLNNITPTTITSSSKSTTALPAASASLVTTDYSSLAQPVPYGPHLTIKGKVLNGWGVLYALCVFSVAVLVLPFMFITATFADLTGNGSRRKMCDWIVHVWANMALQVTRRRTTTTYTPPTHTSLPSTHPPDYLPTQPQPSTLNSLLAISFPPCPIITSLFDLVSSVLSWGRVCLYGRTRTAHLAHQMTLCNPKVYGVENLPKDGETVMYVPNQPHFLHGYPSVDTRSLIPLPCLLPSFPPIPCQLFFHRYVPNHTSFMDILVLSGFVPRPFKYLSKSEIMDIPVIGWAMNLAKHVFLKRDDLKSTMEVSDDD